jgi:hypothetical protein
MSQTSTYVIDEQCLSGKLKNLSAPLKEDAWRKFETYAEAHKRPVAKNRLQNIHFTVNRNVAMPAAFGLIIILFSMLLFNFISVKNPKAALEVPEQNTETRHSGTALYQAETPITKAETRLFPQNSRSTEKSSLVAKQKTTLLNPLKETQDEATENQVESISAESHAQITSNETAARKPSRNRAVLLEEIRPTLVTEDEEPEIRPN